ncbi:unnamed protein product [Closterium sp. Naga37s-1]|nr:unnamed protein product [Closterium sp. Naga37s-1]
MARPDVASRAAGGGRWRGRVAALAYLAAFALAIGTAAAAQATLQEPPPPPPAATQESAATLVLLSSAPVISPADVAGAPPAPVVSAADVAADAEEGQESLLAGLTIVNASSDPGAVCLDGSPPAFNWHPGRGTGRNKWILYLEGGAWCEDSAHCIDRSFSNFGSSTKMGDWLLQGLLSSSRTTNPAFFNWNLVYVRYCDGASFIGNVDEPIQDHEGKPQIYMRGSRVFNAILSHLQAHHGLRSASHVLLSGCSAGGLAALLSSCAAPCDSAH